MSDSSRITIFNAHVMVMRLLLIATLLVVLIVMTR